MFIIQFAIGTLAIVSRQLLWTPGVVATIYPEGESQNPIQLSSAPPGHAVTSRNYTGNATNATNATWTVGIISGGSVNVWDAEYHLGRVNLFDFVKTASNVLFYVHLSVLCTRFAVCRLQYVYSRWHALPSQRGLQLLNIIWMAIFISVYFTTYGAPADKRTLTVDKQGSIIAMQVDDSISFACFMLFILIPLMTQMPYMANLVSALVKTCYSLLVTGFPIATIFVIWCSIGYEMFHTIKYQGQEVTLYICNCTKDSLDSAFSAFAQGNRSDMRSLITYLRHSSQVVPREGGMVNGPYFDTLQQTALLAYKMIFGFAFPNTELVTYSWPAFAFCIFWVLIAIVIILNMMTAIMVNGLGQAQRGQLLSDYQDREAALVTWGDTGVYAKGCLGRLIEALDSRITSVSTADLGDISADYDGDGMVSVEEFSRYMKDSVAEAPAGTEGTGDPVGTSHATEIAQFRKEIQERHEALVGQQQANAERLQRVTSALAQLLAEKGLASPTLTEDPDECKYEQNNPLQKRRHSDSMQMGNIASNGTTKVVAV